MKNDLKNWELFSKQSDFFWQFQQTVALVEIALFSAWYTLYKAQERILTIGVLIIGIFILFLLFLIIRRASQYLNAFRDAALQELPAKLPKPLFGLRTHKIGILIPISLIIFNLLLLVFTIFKI